MRFRAMMMAVLAVCAAAPAVAEVGFRVPSTIYVPTNLSDPISGQFDVTLAVTGSDIGKPASAFAIELMANSPLISFGSATTPSNPLFGTGALLNFSDDNQKIQAAQDLYNSSPDFTPMVNGKGLITAPFSMSTPTVGNYTLSFSGLNELADNVGNSYSLTSNTGTLSVFLGGDFNRDGSVDAADYTVWRDNLNTSVALAYAGADGDGDGMVDNDDYLVWSDNYGLSVTSGAGAIAPEPAALLLALAGGCCALGRRGRR